MANATPHSPVLADFKAQLVVSIAIPYHETGRRRLGRLISGLVLGVLGGLGLLALIGLSQTPRVALAASSAVDTCFATIDAVTIYSSTNNTALQLAANSAMNGDVIKVAGTCAGISVTQGISQVVYIGADQVTVRGGYTTTNWNTSDPTANPTVLNALGLGRGVVISNSTGMLENLTVQNGAAALGGLTPCYDAYYCGGGIYARAGLSLSGVQVLSNTAIVGAGMYVSHTLRMSNSVIGNNNAEFGGGAMVMADVEINSCQFNANVATTGGGLQVQPSARTEIANTLFKENKAGFGGGMLQYPTVAYSVFNAVVLTNSDFISNTGNAVTALSEVWVTGGSFISNTNVEGGAILQQALPPNWSTPLHVTGARFLHNVAADGGAIATMGPVDITDAYFEDNQATVGDGGVINSSWVGPSSQKAMSVRNTTFISNSAVGNGGAVAVAGRVEVSESDFTQNLAQRGGAIYQSAITSFGEPISVSKSHFFSNTSTTNGGAIVSYGNLSLTGGSFISNTAANNGGAIYLANAGPTPPDAEITGTTFTSNVVTSGAGGALNIGAKLILHNSMLTGNKAAVQGGAIYQRPSSPVFHLVQLQNVQVADNVATAGGGLYASGQLDISASQFIRNFGTGGGGGVYLDVPASTFVVMPQRIVSSEFVSNTAFVGGGLYAPTTIGPNVPDTFEIRDSHFVSNTADVTGGAFLVMNFKLLATGNEIAHNRAALGGGLGYGFGGPNFFGTLLTLQNNHIVSNSATNNGGAIFVSSAAPFVAQKNVWQSNTAANQGGAIFINGSGGSRLLREAIYDNVAGNNGGGIFIQQSTTCVVLENSMIAANTVLTTAIAASDIGFGGATRSCLIGKHNTFASATAGNGASIVVGTEAVNDSVELTNTLFNGYSVALQMGPLTATMSADHVLFDGVTAQSNGINITVTNALTGNAHFVSPAQRNYHLLSNSAAIDAGINVGTLTDFDGDTRPQASGMDLGADEADGVIVGLSASNTSPTRLSDTTGFSATVLAGTNVSYVWTFGDASPACSGAAVSHIYASVGVYTATVVASNNANTLTTTTRVTITNAPPMANAGTDQSVSLGGQVVLAGVLSSDPDGHIPLSYGWTQTSGPAVSLSGANSSVLIFTAPNSAGTLAFALVVTDSQGLASVADGVVVTVRDIGITGLSAINSGPTPLGSATIFTATITTGSAVSYTWYFGDGAMGSGISATHTYTATGSYVAYVEADNSNGSVVAQTVAVVITSQQRTYLPQVQR